MPPKRASEKSSVTGYVPASHCVPLQPDATRCASQRESGFLKSEARKTDNKKRRARQRCAFPMGPQPHALLARDLAPPLQQVRAPVRQHLRLGHEPERVVLRATGRGKGFRTTGHTPPKKKEGGKRRRQPTGCVCRIATACSSIVHCCRGACVTPQDAARRTREKRRGRRHRGGGGEGRTPCATTCALLPGGHVLGVGGRRR